jgi:hypothetical protein
VRHNASHRVEIQHIRVDTLMTSPGATSVSWLPHLVRLASWGNDWNAYVEALYQFYRQDFVCGRPLFRQQRVAVKRYPSQDGRDVTFWHLISEGGKEHERLPELRRCERIRWPRPIIEHESQDGVLVWQNERRGERAFCVLCLAERYLVVLGIRGGYLLLKTAYPIYSDKKLSRLIEEYEEYKADVAC